MNKKVLAIVLSITMIVGYSFSALAGTITTSGNSENQNVTATYNKAASSVFSVTITWGDLKYVYDDDVKWDAVNLYYVPASETPSTSWSLYDNTNNNQNALVKVQNDSDKKVKAVIQFTQKLVEESGISGTLTGEFYNNYDFSGGTVTQGGTGTEIGTDADEESDGTALDAYLKITGNPTTITSASVNNGSTIGNVTVTVN